MPLSLAYISNVTSFPTWISTTCLPYGKVYFCLQFSLPVDTIGGTGRWWEGGRGKGGGKEKEGEVVVESESYPSEESGEQRNVVFA